MKVIIIGNGIAGVTVATQLREQSKEDTEITIISSESKYHYSRPALMYFYMKTLVLKNAQPYEEHFWAKNKINLIHKLVTNIDYNQKQITLNNEEVLTYDKLVLAVGSKGNKFGWPGENLPQVITFTNLQDLEKLEKITERANKNFKAVIVGGGLIGIELAEMLSHRKIPVSFLVREAHFMSMFFNEQESIMLEEEIIRHGVDLQLDTQLESILPNESGDVESVITSKDKKISCNIVGLAVGVSPNLSLVLKSELATKRGILVNHKLETNIPDVYACGDCAELQPEGRVEALWYTGKMQANVVAANILGKNIEYNRGILYNSAKFFTIDYHTYGQVGFKIPNEQELYYRVPKQNKSIRIIYLPDRVIGFSILGIRFRHKVCEEWIRENRSLEYVLDNLQQANFDPEFYKSFHKEVKELYHAK